MARDFESRVRVAPHFATIQFLDVGSAAHVAALEEEYIDAMSYELGSHNEAGGATTHDAYVGGQPIAAQSSGVERHAVSPRSSGGVSIIVATRGLAERADLLDAALESILDQRGVRAEPIVVLNGTRACPSVERRLAADPRIRLVRLAEAGLPAALAAGRAAVRTPWFGALDDDDQLLPGALELRVRTLLARCELDVVVTNGFQRTGDRDELNVPRDKDVDAGPLRALFRGNWLLPGSWLCRSERVGVDLFDGMPSYLECTFLAARFATEYEMAWLPEPTVAYRLDSPAAESRARPYVVGQAAALRGILALPLPPDVRREVRGRIAAAHHHAAEYDLRSGSLRAAWAAHVASLRSRGGWRFLPFTRHFIAPLVTR